MLPGKSIEDIAPDTLVRLGKVRLVQVLTLDWGKSKKWTSTNIFRADVEI